MNAPTWSPNHLPSMAGKVVVITGANSGIGFEAARALAKAGAHVVFACRREQAAAEAIERVRSECPSASMEFVPLDLADLSSVRAASTSIRERHERLDVLVNNAGVMALPHRRTVDGFEVQLGTNHLGHFALTALTFDRLARTPHARIVTVSSLMHVLGTIQFDDLHFERGYSRWRAYSQSKLTNLLFAYELERRIASKGLSVSSIACHPGYASTNLQLAAARMEGSPMRTRMWAWINRLAAQSSEAGAWPTLCAATSPDVVGGDFIGPRGPFGAWGVPAKTWSTKLSRDENVAARLWDVSEKLTGVRFPI